MLIVMFPNTLVKGTCQKNILVLIFPNNITSHLHSNICFIYLKSNDKIIKPGENKNVNTYFISPEIFLKPY